MKYTTVFLDRDGVINRKRDDDYVKNWSEFEFLPGAKEALKTLTEKNYRLIVVTNQRGIARGLMTEEDVADIHARMMAELLEAGARITTVLCCPHNKDQCDCRKPKTGMFLYAQRQLPDIDFAKSVMIGDSLSDMEAGAQLGCRNILVSETATTTEDQLCARSLLEAVERYLI